MEREIRGKKVITTAGTPIFLTGFARGPCGIMSSHETSEEQSNLELESSHLEPHAADVEPPKPELLKSPKLPNPDQTRKSRASSPFLPRMSKSPIPIHCGREQVKPQVTERHPRARLWVRQLDLQEGTILWLRRESIGEIARLLRYQCSVSLRLLSEQDRELFSPDRCLHLGTGSAMPYFGPHRSWQQHLDQIP